MHVGFWNYLYLKIGYSYGYHSAIAERHSRPRDSVLTRWKGRRSHVIVRHFLDWTGRHTTDRCGCELTASAAPSRALYISLQHMPEVEDSFGGGLRACAGRSSRETEKGSRAGRHGGRQST
ncbi:hypothetical protein K469DRAFT_703545 [Zopfia rhizophila CBS 207.26]|uniref:Uncharacterized protein n=1 Tax=Zopfia rhizophila CBS 207.26 TaxID=1314779 RepID=A0A6A6E8G7_9PEZI|nr:hypothetical protein K469DRAFT_703545 [Zopfia rhizophila CBS 207.26]